jgi:hypothetical protein
MNRIFSGSCGREERKRTEEKEKEKEKNRIFSSISSCYVEKKRKTS